MYNTFYDVCIYGAGISAAGAALHLLKEQPDCRILIVSPTGFVASECSYSFLQDLSTGISPLLDKFIINLRQAGAYNNNLADACALQIRMLKELEKADILFYARPAGIIQDAGSVKGLIVAAKDGIHAVKAKVFLDLSGDLEAVRSAKSDCIDNAEGDSLFILNLFMEDETLPVPASKKEKEYLISGGVFEEERTIKIKNGSRGDIRRIVKELRSDYPELADGYVARLSNIPIALYASAVKEPLCKAAGWKNFFAPTAELRKKFTFEDHKDLLAVRFAEGEAMAEKVAALAGADVEEPQILPQEICVAYPAEKTTAGVIICGGGTSGMLAAIAAGRAGADVLLLEATDYPGGIGTGGAIPVYYYGLEGGLQDEVDARARECSLLLCGEKNRFPENEQFKRFHVFAKMIVLEEMAAEAGVRIKYGQMLCGTETTEIRPPMFPVLRGTPQPKLSRRLDTVNAVSADCGPVQYQAKVFIDSTGDADIAVFAGAEYTAGREPDAVQHIYSIPALYIFQAAEKNSKGENTRCYYIQFPYNIDAGYVDACDPWDISRARRAGIIAFDREKYNWNTKHSRMQYLAAVVGIRASRQIRGDYKLGLGDQIRAAEFPDVIAYSASHYDNHAKDFENESTDALLWSWALDGHWESIGCEIPYRTMLPYGIENLIVACRALSLDFDANLQFRMQRDMQRIGEAAGLAAAVAVKDDVPPRYIDIRKVQKDLFRTKALLKPESNYHCDNWKPANFYPERRMFELTSKGFAPSRELLPGTVNSYQQLEKDLKSSSEVTRFAAAVKLSAGARIDRVKKDVVQCIQLRCSEFPEGWHGKTPLWKAAIAICGVNRYTDARTVIEDILTDEECLKDQQALILAVRALGEIGNAYSAKMIDRLLQRGDVAHTQEFFYWCSEKTIVDDSSWKLELAAFEAMKKLGLEKIEYLKKYENDERGYVRRAAERVRLRVYGETQNEEKV